jgi:hypothetical protein
VSDLDLGADEALRGCHESSDDAFRQGALGGIAKRRVTQGPFEPILDHAAPPAHGKRAAEPEAGKRYHSLEKVAS